MFLTNLIQKIKNRKNPYPNLREHVAKYVEENYGAEYVEEVLYDYDTLGSGGTIGGLQETIAFLSMIKDVKAQYKGD